MKVTRDLDKSSFRRVVGIETRLEEIEERTRGKKV